MNRIGQLGMRIVCASLLVGILSRPARLSADEAKPEKPEKQKSEVKQASLERPEPKKVELPAPPKEIVEALLKLHNEVRARQGLRPLKLHPKLTAAAQRYAEYSHRSNSFGHYADGRSPSARISAEGLRHGSWAENMAWGHRLPQDAMHTWLGSSVHHGNILSGHTHVGFGKVGSIWVTVFANPAEREEKPPAFVAEAGGEG